jgi:hypothetical protein
MCLLRQFTRQLNYSWPELLKLLALACSASDLTIYFTGQLSITRHDVRKLAAGAARSALIFA